jgi:nicotinamide mononucleotide adenylyltransferase
MTNINNTQTNRFFKTGTQRTLSEFVLTAASKLGIAIGSRIGRRQTVDPKTRAERACMAESVREIPAATSTA